MSVLVIGISHNSAPVSLLERVAVEGGEGVAKLVHDAASAPHVTEALVLSTCNRIEIYTEVDRFHGSVEAISKLLVDRSGESTEALLPHLYVHYDDGAVGHLFQVAAGLDSMAVGEGQILGQVREALRGGQELGSVGPALNALFQQALRVGKRARAETDIDSVAPSLVSAALSRSADVVGALRGRHVTVIGAGAMAGLATATVARAGAGEIVVVNRSADRADRLAAEYGARTATFAQLGEEIADSDILLTCTGAVGVVVTREAVERARVSSDRPLLVIDLALPHDVEPSVAELPGVTLVGLAELSAILQTSDAGREVVEVRRIVTDEVASFLTARRSASVAPTVVALRTMATSVVDAEITRLEARLPGLDDLTRAEIRHAVRRVADKLLHEPTVRVKELAGGEGAVSYERALAELFALDPDAVDAVTRPPGDATRRSEP